MVAAAVLNSGYARPSRTISPLDFVPGADEKKDLNELSPEEQANYVINQMSKKEYV